MNRSKTHLIVAALIRSEDKILLVRQKGPNDPISAWALPGGVVEPNELLNEALIREVREETGLTVHELGKLIYVTQFDNRAPEQLHTGLGSGNGYESIAFVFEIAKWKGELKILDPDGYVQEVAFFTLEEAIAQLEKQPFRVMREPLLAYLKKITHAGTIWLYRSHSPNQVELIAQLKNE